MGQPLFLNVGGKPSDPWGPLEVASVARERLPDRARFAIEAHVHEARVIHRGDRGHERAAGEREPIQLWRDPARWLQERQRQFPGSEPFWQLCARLHRSSWAFASRDPVLPPRSPWDLGQLLAALDPGVLTSGVFTAATIADLLKLCGCAGDARLRRFLDLQLRLYSQEPADRTAALYGATVLAMAQAPLGLWHLEGSMQQLSTALEQALAAAGGQLRLRHRVVALRPRAEGGWCLEGQGPAGRSFQLEAAEVVCSLPPQTTPALRNAISELGPP